VSEPQVTTGLVDFHCHLDLYPDHAAAMTECERAGVFTLAVTTTPKAWPRNSELASTNRHVRVALGLHPQLVADRAGDLKIWEQYLPKARYIGEVGLDAGPRFVHSLDLQKLVFQRILRACARSGSKILTVHSVRAAASVLDMLKFHLPPARGRVVLHWFTGSEAESRRAVDLGCYFSVNSKMLQTERGQRLVASLPLDRLLTETDGPFTRMSGRVTRPIDVATTVDELARTRGTTSPAMASAIRGNLRALLDSADIGGLSRPPF
jgi:TatD DNase family protein